MRHIIDPYVGLGPLRFGMTPDEVAQFDNVFGQVQRDRFQAETGVRTELRTHYSPYCQYKNNRLWAIDTNLISRPFSLVLDNIDIYAIEPRDALKALEIKNGGAQVNFAYVYFNKLGLVLRDFYEITKKTYSNKEKDRQVGIYSREAAAEFVKVDPKYENLPYIKFEAVSFR